MKKRPQLRISQSWSPVDCAVLESLCQAVLAGKDVRVIARHKSFASLSRKAKRMAERARKAVEDRCEYDAASGDVLELRREQIRQTRIRSLANRAASVREHRAATEHAIITAVMNGAVTNDQIAEATGMNWFRVREGAQRLHGRGEMSFGYGQGPGFGWRVTRRASGAAE